MGEKSGRINQREGLSMAVRVLYVATVVKKHIMQFHIPFLKMFKDAGWETAVAARNDYVELGDCDIPYCDTYYDVPFERLPIKTKNFIAYRELKKIIEQGEYDIIHCHTPVGAMLTRLAARNVRRKGTKVIYTAHGFHFYKGAPLKNWLLYYPVERFLARWTDALITINKEDYNRARNFKAQRCVYIPGVGIDVNKFSKPISGEERHKIRAEMGVTDDAILICSVGELNINKNHSLVIRAMAQLASANVHYCIAGEGEYHENLMSLPRELGIKDRVHLLGYCSDVHALYQASDIFCFPSLREGLPVALMEAMASGLPCAASRIRGNIDLLGEDNEILFDPMDVEECKKRLEYMIDNITIGQKADSSEALSQFSKDSVMRQMREVYGIIE